MKSGLSDMPGMLTGVNEKLYLPFKAGAPTMVNGYCVPRP